MGLRDLQCAFAQALRVGDASTRPAALAETGSIPVQDRFAIYRNNGRIFFRQALALAYPVLLRRVGDEFFARLVHDYRADHPSRSGDLHFAGAAFPAWLGGRFNGTQYAWLADLARLEWACEEAATAAVRPWVTLEALGGIDATALDGVTLELQPSLRLVASEWPVWSVWRANQGAAEATPVDLATGPEHCACACLDEGIVTYRLAPDGHAVLARLQSGATLGEAAADAGAEVVGNLLGWAFAERLVVEISPSARA